MKIEGGAGGGWRGVAPKLLERLSQVVNDRKSKKKKKSSSSNSTSSSSSSSSSAKKKKKKKTKRKRSSSSSSPEPAKKSRRRCAQKPRPEKKPKDAAKVDKSAQIILKKAAAAQKKEVQHVVRAQLKTEKAAKAAADKSKKECAKAIQLLSAPEMVLSAIEGKIKNKEATPTELFEIDFTAIHGKVKEYIRMAKAYESGESATLGISLSDVNAAVKEANAVTKVFSSSLVVA
jgi:hypothetical protein